ncbi:MAG TPA: hypothetical protein VK963_01900, partial [Candidatus Saccharimonadales bacterium]|nr:hypothetical protein [Candidatus Saccharimonadales bacterium]
MKPLLHQATQDRLEALVRRPRGAYIFTGPPHVGKLTTALWLAQRFNCSGTGDDGCRACRLIEAGNHPDVTVVRPADKASIGIAQVQQLQQAVSLTRDSTEGRRVVAITPSDNLTTEAQNCLLKTIEEPPLGTIIILAVEQLTGLLGTVRSRCQVVQFLPLETGRVSAYLQDQLSLPVAQADHMAELAAGSVGLAISLGR